MSEQAASTRNNFRTVLREQQQRVVTVLAAEETIDATPIVRADETLSSEEYVTLVYELHHFDLPELEDSGVIEFDRLEETVRKGKHFDESRSLREHSHDR